MNNSFSKILHWDATRDSSWRISKLLRRDSERVEHHTLLKVLQIASDGKLPIESLLLAYAKEQSSAQSRLIRKVAELIRTGTPTIAALEQVPGLLNDEQLLSLRFASQSGNLPATLRRLTDLESSVGSEREISSESNWVYWLSVALITVFIWSLMMSFIWPTFRRIGLEFEIETSLGPLHLMAYAWEICVSFWPICLMVLSVSIALLFSTRLQRFVTAKIRPWIRGRSKRVSPITFELLASSVEEGKPLLSGMSTLGKYHYGPLSRQCMLVARNEIEQGANDIDGMQNAKVLNANEAAALREFSTPAGQAYVLRSIATRDRKRLQSREYRNGLLLEPIVIVALGIPVLWICGSFFYMITRLISSLA
ncbi:MAG: type II secretion system F family protein [Pirellula sp.]